MPDPSSVRALDLNLLLALDTLLAERHVTRAAAVLGVTQPAASAALARLRVHFDDELLYRVDGRYVLTPLALRLLPMTERALGEVRRVFDATDVHRPATSTREYTVLASDYVAIVLGGSWSRLVRQQAPQVRLRIESFPREMLSNWERALRDVDGVILPQGIPPAGSANIDLFDDSWSYLVDNDTVGDAPMSLEELARRPWATTVLGREGRTPAFEQLRAMSIQPRIEVVAESFAALPFFVAGTDRVAVLQSRLVHSLAQVAGVTAYPCPWPTTELRAGFFWHPSLSPDPGHVWLRRTLTDASHALGPIPRP